VEALRLDAVIVALPDRLHLDAAEAVMRERIPMLLEKPAASTENDLDRLRVTARDNQAQVAVGHVLRFTPFWSTIETLVRSGVLGRLQTIDLRENIGYWHFAHSYVRGNWKRADTSSPMVLAKTCHDLDLIRWLAGAPPTEMFSVGSLSYFREENAPAGAPDFCVEGCPAAESCPFYAPRYYVDALAGVTGVPVTLVTRDVSRAGRLEALRTSDYGRCVFRSENDVADHQQTTMRFSSGLTATLTASAFTGENTREVDITGSMGQIKGHMDSGRIVLDLFGPDAAVPQMEGVIERVDRVGILGHLSITMNARPEASATGDHRGHAGGDDGLMDAFLSALESGGLGGQLSLQEALDSHYMAFCAERSRLSGQSAPFSTPGGQGPEAKTSDVQHPEREELRQ
jgi:predicted dehydrogenase